MAEFVREGGTLSVSGRLSAEDFDALLARGRELLAVETREPVLDMRGAAAEDSKFVGAVAQLGAEACARDKNLIVRASGRAADLLVWAGLYRVAILKIAREPAAAKA